MADMKGDDTKRTPSFLIPVIAVENVHPGLRYFIYGWERGCPIVKSATRNVAMPHGSWKKADAPN